MRDKGFTLTELLAVIVVLAILVAIAVPSYFVISNNTKKQLYQNKIDLIRTQSLKYAEDNNIDGETISVNTLINEGYIGNDSNKFEEYKQIVNPYPTDENDNYMDCYTIDILQNNDEYIATVNKNNDCSILDNLSASSLVIDVFSYNTTSNKTIELLGKNINNIKWTKDDVILYIEPNNLGNIESVSWNIGGNAITKASGNILSSIAPNQSITSDYDNIYIVNASSIINATYKASLKSDTGVYSGKVHVRIDKEKPLVNASVASEWSNDLKKVVLDASDGNGSGIKGYKVISNNVSNANGYEDKTSFDLGSGTYYAFAIDNVGNISDSFQVVIDNIDSNGPQCVDNTSSIPQWSKNDVTITWGCSDNATGCKTPNVGSRTFTSTPSGGKFVIPQYQIEDNIGNKKTCPSKTVEIQIDKTPPACKYTEVPASSWTNSARTIKLWCEDSESGCTTTNIKQQTYNTSTTTASFPDKAYQISDKAGNTATCNVKTVNVYVDINKPTCTNNNYSDWTRSNRSISYGCSDTGGSGCVKTTEKTENFTTTTKTYTIPSYTIKDKAGNSVTCPSKTVNVLIDKNGPTCTVSGGSTTWINTARTITYKCSDTGSGCVDTTITKSYSNVKTAPKITMKDKAGNQTDCAIANVYSDTIAPNPTGISIRSYFGNYNSFMVKATISGTDNLSGIKEYCITNSYYDDPNNNKINTCSGAHADARAWTSLSSISTSLNGTYDYNFTEYKCQYPTNTCFGYWNHKYNWGYRDQIQINAVLFLKDAAGNVSTHKISNSTYRFSSCDTFCRETGGSDCGGNQAC